MRNLATGVAAGRGRGGRFSAGRKREVVMQPRVVSRAVGITAARASHWRAQFLAAGQAGLKSRAPDARDEDHRRRRQDRRAADGDRVTVREGGPAGGWPGGGRAMSGESITRRAYGVQRVCRVWHAPAPVCILLHCVVAAGRSALPRTTSWWPTFAGCSKPRFHGEGYRKAWAKLRMRTSKERVRRLMREHDLQAPPRAGHAHGPKAHDGTITTEAPDVMWGPDGHRDGRRGGGLRLRGRRSLRDRMHRAPCRQAREPLRGRPIRHIRERFGGIGEGVARGLRLRHDGSNYLADFQQEVAFFGIESSPSSCGSPKAGVRSARTLKENRCGCGLRDDRSPACSSSSGRQRAVDLDYRSPAQVRRDLLGPREA